MGLVLIIIGGVFVAYYFIFINGRTSDSRQISLEQEMLAFRQNYDNQMLEGLDLSRFELLPKPQSKKGLYALFVLGCFAGAVFCIFSALGARYFSSSFWLFIAACLLFGFGCYFMSWVRQADEWLLEAHRRITEINDYRIKERQQVVDHHIAGFEAVAQAKLRSEKVQNEILRQETEKIDAQITNSLEPEARRVQVPLSSYVLTRATDFATKAELENLRIGKQVETDAEHKRAINQNKIDKDKAHNILNASERASYPKLKSEYDDKLRVLKRELEELKVVPAPTPAQKVDIAHLTEVIRETEEEKNALRRNFLQSSNGQEIERASPAS